MILSSLNIFSPKKRSSNWKKLLKNSTKISNILWHIPTLLQKIKRLPFETYAQIEYVLSSSSYLELDPKSKKRQSSWSNTEIIEEAKVHETKESSIDDDESTTEDLKWLLINYYKKKLVSDISVQPIQETETTN